MVGRGDLGGVSKEGEAQGVCAALLNTIWEVLLLACCRLLHFRCRQVARGQAVMQPLHITTPLQ